MTSHVRLVSVLGLLTASALLGCSSGVQNDALFNDAGAAGSDDNTAGTSDTSAGKGGASGKAGSGGKSGSSGKGGSSAGTSAGAADEGGAGGASGHGGHTTAGKAGTSAGAGDTGGTGSDVFGGGGISAGGKSNTGGKSGASSASCDGQLADNACGHCVEASCCPEVQACLNDDTCLACVENNGSCTGSVVDDLDSCATQNCNAECNDTGSGGSGGATGDGGTCCEATGDLGCSNSGIESCVCNEDDYCCTTEWDGTCVGEVSEFGCSDVCDGGTGGSGGSGSTGGSFACGGPSTSPSNGSCLKVSGANKCNPVTNVGCTGKQTCDTLDGSTFSCLTLDAADTNTCGDSCGSSGYCVSKSICLDDGNGNGTCARYCCTDADCGSNGTCDTSSYLDSPVGVCVTK